MKFVEWLSRFGLSDRVVIVSLPSSTGNGALGVLVWSNLAPFHSPRSDSSGAAPGQLGAVG